MNIYKKNLHGVKNYPIFSGCVLVVFILCSLATSLCDSFVVPGTVSIEASHGLATLDAQRSQNDQTAFRRCDFFLGDVFPHHFQVSNFLIYLGVASDVALQLLSDDLRQEGVPEMAERMAYVITAMASAYEVRAPDILAVRYEDITNSSEHFDAAIENPGQTQYPVQSFLTRCCDFNFRVCEQRDFAVHTTLVQIVNYNNPISHSI
jgi:hypothetical protein